MKLKWIIVTIIFTFLVTGCWDRRELDQIGIVYAIGIDKDPGTSEYIVTLQIVRPSTLQPLGGGKQEDVVENFSVKEKTLLAAIRLSTRQFDRRPFFFHNKVVVIGEDLAKEGIIPLLDVFRRGKESRELTWYFVAKGVTAKEILGVKTGIETIQGSYLEKVINNSKRENAKTSNVRGIDLAKKLMGAGVEPVIGFMEIIKDENPEVEKQKKTKHSKGVFIRGTAVFKQDRLVGHLNDSETRGLNWATNQAKGGVIIIPALIQKDQLASVEIQGSNGKITPKIIKDSIHFTIDVEEESIISEIESQGVELKGKAEKKFLEYQNQLEKEVEKVIEQEITGAILKAQKLKSDIFGFGQALHKKYPKRWEKVEGKWSSVFSEVEFDVKVKVHIRRTGNILEPIIPKE